MFRTPKRTKIEEDINRHMLQLQQTPPNKTVAIHSSAEKSSMSPSSSFAVSPTELKRGRPRAEILNSLILHGSTSPSSIRCNYCNRVFPREKSLQAHLRTHTGEKPFACDFPRCIRRFAQSGQLKTHQRLHTGEKPFVCSASNCNRRFTHANRHCPDHKDLALRRYHSPCDLSINNVEGEDENYKHEIQKWIENIKSRDKNTNNYAQTPKKIRNLCQKWYSDTESNEDINIENDLNRKHQILKFRSLEVLTDNCTKSNEDYTDNLDENVMEMKRFNSCNELPKKRWLRAAALEQQLCASDTNQDLALPINWNDESSIIEHENQKRPTVLVKMGNSTEETTSSADMQIAMALVELGQNRQHYSY